ncbi:hypothetical protein T484DRAFT_1805658 [Baffinella frigidus]|nr:hypothetical protein T484DRAFT_1805658 [Cryptophyta sp. CCMP2293]
MPKDQQRHQQVVEDLVNDLLCNCSSFGSTTADPPRRRRRMRPTHLASPSGASYIPLGAPFVQGPSGPPSVSPLALPSPTTSLKYDSLRAHSREASSCSTPTTSRSKSAVARSSTAEELSQPALARTPSPPHRNVASGLSTLHLKSATHAIIATLPRRLTIADLGGGVCNSAMLRWEHQERVGLARRCQGAQERLELEAEHDDAERLPNVLDSLFAPSRSKSLPLARIHRSRQNVFDLAIRAGEK